MNALAEFQELDPILQEILHIFSKHPQGIRISFIEDQLSHVIPRRTLSRHLNSLTELGKIHATGEKKGKVYFFIQKKDFIPMSEKSKNQKLKVNSPLQMRIPVSYDKNFLYDYFPNETFYLSEKERETLLTLGQQFKIDLPPGTYIVQIYQRMLIDLSWNSSRLEGNTYSLLETQRLIEFGLKADGKNTIESQMIINHKEAIEFIVKNVNSPQMGLNKYTIFNLDALLSNNLLKNPRARGAIRKIPVGIGGSVYRPCGVPQVVF